MQAGIHICTTGLSPLPSSPLRRVCTQGFWEDFVFTHHCANAVLQFSDISHKTNYRNFKGLISNRKGNLPKKKSSKQNEELNLQRNVPMAIICLRGTCRWGCDPKITSSVAVWSHRTCLAEGCGEALVLCQRGVTDACMSYHHCSPGTPRMP